MNEHTVSAKLVMRLRRATGLPVLAAKRALLDCDVADRLEYVIATENRPLRNGNARDPQEDDELLGPIIRATLDSVTKRVIREYDKHIARMREDSPVMADFLSPRRGICHRIWRETKQQLVEDHGIDWLTPAEVNPGTVFD